MAVEASASERKMKWSLKRRMVYVYCCERWWSLQRCNFVYIFPDNDRTCWWKASLLLAYSKARYMNLSEIQELKCWFANSVALLINEHVLHPDSKVFLNLKEFVAWWGVLKFFSSRLISLIITNTLSSFDLLRLQREIQCFVPGLAVSRTTPVHALMT